MVSVYQRTMISTLFRRSYNCLQTQTVRNLSYNNIIVDVDDNTKVATINLHRPPVNNLDLTTLSELIDSIKELEKQEVNGLILSSNKDGVFSGGLHIPEFQTSDREKLRNFWVTFRNSFIDLFKTRLPTVALLNGHCCAGGLVLSTACEYRIMLNNYKIGANETQVGMVAPLFFMERVRDIVGPRQAELVFTTGALFPTTEALKMGLVDEIAENKIDGYQKAQHFFDKFTAASRKARGLTKSSYRSQYLEKMIADGDEEIEQTINYFMNNDAVQSILSNFLQKSKNK